MVKIMPELALGPSCHICQGCFNTRCESQPLPPGETHQLLVVVVSVFNSAAQFRFCREPSRDAPGVKSIVRIAHRLPGAYCSALSSFKCGRNNAAKSRSLNKSLTSFLPALSFHSQMPFQLKMAKPPFHNEGNNEVDPSKGKQGV